MPAKAALATTAPTPFKGESFPQYVLYRSTRGSIIEASAIVQPRAAIPLPVAQVTAASSCDQDPPLPRRARVPAVGLAKRPLPSPSRRPSLSEQLQTISQGAQALTTQLAATYHLPGRAAASTCGDVLAFAATTISLGVGQLACRFPCPATFASDRCTYVFQHPFEAKEVLMVMYYRDMRHASVNVADRSFRFRLPRVLEHFGADYNPANAQHWLRLVLASSSDALKVKRFLATRGVLAAPTRPATDHNKHATVPRQQESNGVLHS